MKTNDLRKGSRVQLSNGWFATITDNGRGKFRTAERECCARFCDTSYTRSVTFVRELGSVYAHDIYWVNILVDYDPSKDIWEEVEHTPAQVALRATVAPYSTFPQYARFNRGQLIETPPPAFPKATSRNAPRP